MTQRPRIVIAQQQRLALNTSLQGAIRLLRSDTAGLTRYLEEQAADNPHLRLVPALPQPGDWLPRWTGMFATGGAGFGRSALPGAEPPERAAPSPSLIAHVLAAIQTLDLPRAQQRLALALVEALEPSGWLGQRPEEIARNLGVTTKELEEVLVTLQSIDPPGLFARDLADCLRLQALERGQMDSVMAVVLAHLDLLAAGNLAALARLARCDETAITDRFRRIRAMNPKPGTAFSQAGPGPQPDALREPDLIARPLRTGNWQVSLNRSALPDVEVIVAPKDGNAARTPAGNGAALSAARALRQLVQARNATLLRVGREIAGRQIAALIQGPGALAPMTMAEVAEALGLHVSTISRVVAGSSLDGPSGVWWLRQMFSGARGGGKPGQTRAQGGGGPGGTAADPDMTPPPRMAAAALRHLLARLIAEEPAGLPLSDVELTERLMQESGIRLARRTVAQYREALNIPPAHRRKGQGWQGSGGRGV